MRGGQSCLEVLCVQLLGALDFDELQLRLVVGLRDPPVEDSDA